VSYTLYIGNKNYSTWSLRAWVLLRVLGIPFQEQRVTLYQPDTPTHIRQVSPSSRVPCLHDDTTVVWDSLAITEYLAERHRGVWAADAVARAWARSAAAEMHSGFARRLRHAAHDLGEARDREAFLKNEARAQIQGLCAAHRQIVHRPVNGQPSNVAARKKYRGDHKRVSSKCQASATDRDHCLVIELVQNGISESR